MLLAAAALIPLAGWATLTKTLIAYGYAARIPVAIVIFFAIRGNWGTHYDGPPPNFPPMGFWPKYILIGLLPQLILWITFTVITGSLFGIAAVAIRAARGRSIWVQLRTATIALGVVGFALGGLIAFLLRPSVPMVGQLDFFTVITRGARLAGLDQLLVPAAQTSFNVMLAGALLGGAVGAVVGHAFSGRGSRATT